VKYEPDRYKNIGFKPPSSLEPEPEIINIGELEHLSRQIHGDFDLSGFEVLDLTALGVGKILGRGSISTPLKVKVNEFSQSAKEKIEKTGGSIIET
jgi:large subunit ribosomal protein L15